MTKLVCVLRGKELYELFDMISRLVHEVRLHATLDGIDIRFADPANVVAVKIWIPSEVCDYYRCDEEFEVGVDVDRVRDFLSIVKNETVEFKIEEYTNAIVIEAGNLKYTLASIDPNAIRKPPALQDFERIKEITDDCTVEIDAKMFREIIKTAKREYGSKLVAFVHTPEETYVYNGLKKFEPYFYCYSSEVVVVYSAEYLEPLLHISADSYTIHFSKNTQCLVEPDCKFDIEYVVSPYTMEEKELKEFLPTEIVEYKYKFIILAEEWEIYKKVLNPRYPWHLLVKPRGEVYFVAPYYNLVVPVEDVFAFTTLEGEPSPRGDVFAIDVSAFRDVKGDLEVVCIDDKIYVNGKEVGEKPDEESVISYVRELVRKLFDLYDKIKHEAIRASFNVKELTPILKETDTIALYCENGDVYLSPAILYPNNEWGLEKTYLKRLEAHPYCEPFVRVLRSPGYVVGSIIEFVFTTTPKTPAIARCYVEHKKEYKEVLWIGITPVENEEEAIKQIGEIIYGKVPKGEQPKEQPTPKEEEVEIEEELEEEKPTVSPEDLLPESEQQILQTMFEILTKNGWRFSKFDKKWFFKFKKHGIKTYKDRYIFAKLFKKYGGQFENILSKMSEEDKQKLAETGFFELYERYKKGERLFTDVKVERKEKEEPWMKDEPFDEEFVRLYNEFSHFWVDPNKEFKKEIKAIEDKIIMEFGEIPKSIEPALRNYRKALYEFFKAEARARAIAPPVTVVGPSKYKGKPEQAQRIREKALENLEHARKWLEEAIARERRKRTIEKVEEEVQLRIDELKGSRLKKDLGLDVASKIWDYKHKDGSGDFGFMLKKGEKWVRLIGSYTPSGKVYGLMIETSEHAPQPIPEDVRTYEDLINYLAKYFGIGKEELRRKAEERVKEVIESQLKKAEDAVIKQLSERISKAEIGSILEYELRRRGYSRDIIEKAIGDLIHKGVIERVGKYLRLKKVLEEEKPPVEEKPPKEEKPVEEKAKPPAEPYDFILEKLKSAFLAELELANYRPEDFDLSDVMKQIDELAKEVYEGRKEQVEAVKETILKAREFIQATERVKQKFLDLAKKGDEIVKSYDKEQKKVVTAEELTEGEASAIKSKLDDIIRELKSVVKELKKLYKQSKFKEIMHKIEEYENVIEEAEGFKKEIDEKVVKLPEHVRKILEQLKSTFVAQLELAGFGKEEIEKELISNIPTLESLAYDVAEGRITLRDAIKRIADLVRMFIPLPQPKRGEVKVEKPIVAEEKPTKPAKTKTAKVGKTEIPSVGVTTKEIDEILRREFRDLALFGVGYVFNKHPELTPTQQLALRASFTEKLHKTGEDLVRNAKRGLQWLAGKLLSSQASNIAERGIRPAMEDAWSTIKSIIEMNYPDILKKYGEETIKSAIMGQALVELGVPYEALPEDMRNALRLFS